MKRVSLSDSSYSARSYIYGQTAILCGITGEDIGIHDNIIHLLTWISHKKIRVSYSSFGAEILEAADSNDRSSDLNMS